MEMSYGNFFIRFELKFWRNIYSDEELVESTQTNTLENYYLSYQKFINICIGVLSIFGTNSNIDDSTNTDLKEFLEEKFPEIYDIDKLTLNLPAQIKSRDLSWSYMPLNVIL